MIIEFSWGTGKMSVDPDLLIVEMPLVNYRKWLKLFIKYGGRNDHIQMIHCLCNQLISIHGTIKELEAEVHRWKGFTSRYGAGKRKVASDQLRAAKRQHKRIIKMWDALRGRLT